MSDSFFTVHTASQFGMIAMSACTVLCFIRLAIGPSLPDRVVALDMIATFLVGLLVLHGISTSNSESLRVATVLALVNFFGTIAFASYIRR